MKKKDQILSNYLAIAALAFAVGTMFGVASVEAQNTNNSGGAQGQALERPVDEKGRDAALEARCQRNEDRIDDQINKLQKNQQNRVNAYEQITNKFDNLVVNLEGQGYDTLALESAVDNFKLQLESFYAEHERLMSQLQNTRNYACGDSEGQFRGELQKAREQLRIAHQKRLELRRCFVDEVRPLILDIREQTQTRLQSPSEQEITEEVN
jgi:hypothetical protein